MKAGYSLSIGGWSVKSDDDPRTELVRLEAARGLGGADDHCLIELYAPPKPKAGLLEQAAGAAMDALGMGGASSGPPPFSVDVRGQAITYGDPIVIELKSGDDSGKVMTAKVESIATSPQTVTIRGSTGMRRLAATRTNQAFENRSLGQIAQDLCSAAGVDKGAVASGASYPYLIVDEGRSLLRHLRDLARREGLDLWFDEEDHLVLQAFSKTSADHKLRYGAELLSLELTGVEQLADKAQVHGESPSSNLGSDTWYWLVKDPSPFRGEAGEGSRNSGRADAALRTKDAADLLAKSTAGEWKDRSRTGRARLLGRPGVQLGQAIEISDAPRPELNGLFKVTSLRHVYGKRTGFTTTVGFSGSGGAAAAGGGLLGALGGALGL
jgi:hypothetical protein